MAKKKKGFKLKYVLIPVAGVVGTIAVIFTFRKMRENNF